MLFEDLRLKESRADKMAACPRCTAVQSKDTWAIGDISCVEGDLSGYPDANNQTCLFDPKPAITPTKRSGSIFQQLGVGIDGVEDQTGSEMSGECVIWEEHYSQGSQTLLVASMFYRLVSIIA